MLFVGGQRSACLHRRNGNGRPMVVKIEAGRGEIHGIIARLIAAERNGVRKTVTYMPLLFGPFLMGHRFMDF